MGILNNNQSVSLIPKPGSRDYSFLISDLGIEKSLPGLQH